MAKRLMNKRSLANLAQNKGKSQEELDQIWDSYYAGTERDKVWEDRIQTEFQKYAEAYDLDELMPNDIAVLRSLIQATLRLDYYEHELNRLSEQSVSAENIVTIDRLSSVCENARKSISSMQADLNITRKTRRNEDEETPLSHLQKLKEKAKKFYKQKMLYILCPNCHSVLATIWTHFPESKQNKITLYCMADVDGKSCNTQLELNLANLYKAKVGSNDDQFLPESMR